MKSLSKHLIEESMINKYDSAYSGISKVLSNHKVKNIDFVFDTSGSMYGKNYKKWTDQADMIISQAGQWGIRERDCNFWEAGDGEVKHLRLGQAISTQPSGYTTSLDVIMNELNPNPYSLVVIFTDTILDYKLPLNPRCPIVIVSDEAYKTGDNFAESRGIYFITNNDLGTQAPWPGIVKASGSGRGGMYQTDIDRLAQAMEDGCVMGEDGNYYAVSPESILFVFDENAYPIDLVAKTVRDLEKSGYKWCYRNDQEALRYNRDLKRIPR